MTLIQNTAVKIKIARILYRIVRLFIGRKRRVIRRNGILYEIDPSEGIDFSLFLFGNFQKHVLQISEINTAEEFTIIDIGANIGVMTLNYAKNFEKSVVYAFEPTDYAYAKLQKNIELNPTLAARIRTVKAFASDRNEENPQIVAYSSWKLEGNEINRHSVHQGTPKKASDTPAITLSDFVKQHGLSRVRIIKIDTDGHEWEVLKGAEELINEQKPWIVFECGLYVLEEHQTPFLNFYNFFISKGYQLLNLSSNHIVDNNNYNEEIPKKGTTDILAKPKLIL